MKKMEKMENWKEDWKNIDTEPTKTELLKEAAIMFVVIPWKIIWFFLRPILIIATIFFPGTSSIFFGADNYKEEEIIPDYTPKWRTITTKSGLSKDVMIGTSEEYDDSD